MIISQDFPSLGRIFIIQSVITRLSCLHHRPSIYRKSPKKSATSQPASFFFHPRRTYLSKLQTPGALFSRLVGDLISHMTFEGPEILQNGDGFFVEFTTPTGGSGGWVFGGCKKTSNVPFIFTKSKFKGL